MEEHKEKIAALKKQIAELRRAEKSGPLTFAEWAKDKRRMRLNPCVVPRYTYAGAVDYRYDVDHLNPRGFVTGESPVLMRGSLAAMTCGGDYQAVARYAGRVLARYTKAVRKPTIFFHEEWRKYCDEIEVKLRNNAEKKGRQLYMGRRDPWHERHGGLDHEIPSFMVNGKIFPVRSKREDWDDANREISDRVEMLTLFARTSEKIKSLSA